MRSSPRPFGLTVLLAGSIAIAGCSVGATVNLEAPTVGYPVSMTSSFHTSDHRLVVPGRYEVLDRFSFTFTKWGVASDITIEGDEDLSTRLDAIVERHGGDAIVDMRISVRNPARNGFLLMVKSVAIASTLITVPLFVISPDLTTGLVALGSIGVYAFTPAAALIRVDGTVVRMVE
jgi:hypothetical protein